MGSEVTVSVTDFGAEFHPRKVRKNDVQICAQQDRVTLNAPKDFQYVCESGRMEHTVTRRTGEIVTLGSSISRSSLGKGSYTVTITVPSVP